MKLLLLYFLAIVLGSAATGRAARPDAFFEQGLAAEHAGQFAEASAAFANSIKDLPAAGTLVNLGLAEWQRGHAGAAIMAWEQAQWIDPFNINARKNLQFARQIAQVDSPQLKWFETASTWLPPNDWVWLAGASLWLAVGALVLPGILRKRKSGWQQTLAALGFCLFLFSLTANYGVVSRTQIGFVLKKNAALRLTPTKTSEMISTLNVGESARRLRARGNYYFIQTSGAVGWIERDLLGLTCPE